MRAARFCAAGAWVRRSTMVPAGYLQAGHGAFAGLCGAGADGVRASRNCRHQADRNGAERRGRPLRERRVAVASNDAQAFTDAGTLALPRSTDGMATLAGPFRARWIRFTFNRKPGAGLYVNSIAAFEPSSFRRVRSPADGRLPIVPPESGSHFQRNERRPRTGRPGRSTRKRDSNVRIRRRFQRRRMLEESKRLARTDSGRQRST